MKTGFIAGGGTVRVSLLAIALPLAACTSVSGPIEPTSVEGCRIETRRELRHNGPPGKFPPTPVSREVRVCRAVATGSAGLVASR
jgi:hypothetical protein